MQTQSFRKEQTQRLQDKEMIAAASDCAANFSDNASADDNSHNDTSEYSDDESKIKKMKLQSKTGASLYIDPNILGAPAVVSAANRNKVSHTAMAQIIRSVVKESGGDPKIFNLSASSAFRNESGNKRAGKTNKRRLVPINPRNYPLG
ncbi:MAG: hypothetical protein GY777_27135 [Candidatus Brocadiaceae bacterium]|nr:hypothetical protein [Candidatus Brocadiaceae bacterium]